MAPRTVYANLADGLQPFNLWDQSLADMGALGVTPCTAVGANAVVLTPIAGVFAPNVATPQALQAFSFVAAANSTGSATIQVGTLAAKPLYRMDGVTQATTGDLTATVTYVVNYNAALNGAAGGFQILAPISNEINPVISGATISGSTITTSTYNGNTWTAGTGILTITALKTLTASNTLTLAGVDGKTLTFNNSITFSGTDGTTLTFPSTSATIARTDAGQTFTGTNAFGILTATTVNGNTFTAGTYTLTGTAGKTLNFTNSLTLSGTDATTMTFPTTSATIARTDAANTFTGTQTIGALVATTFNGNTLTTGTFTLTGTAAKTLTFSNTLTLAGTDGTTMTFPTTSATLARTDAGNSFTGNQSATGSILSSSASAGVGYATGSGGTVTQLTSRTTGVTINTINGAITLFSAAGSSTPAIFTVTNSSVVATDIIHLSQRNGNNGYSLHTVAVAAGSFQVMVYASVGTATEAPIINFAVIKGVNS